MQRRLIATGIAIVGLAIGCKKKRTDDGSNAAASLLGGLATKGGSRHSDGDPCSLLDPTEVAAAIGPLASPPYRGGYRPDAKASTCRYDTKDHRRVILDVDWSGGSAIMSMTHKVRGMSDQAVHNGVLKPGQAVTREGDTLAGDWDEVAMAPFHCCMLDALRGDQHLQLDWAGTRLTTVAAAALLNAAVKRLDHPLPIDGAAGIPAAMAAYATLARDSALDACSLLSQADAEAILGAKLLAAPSHVGTSTNLCQYSVQADRMNQEYDVEIIAWNDGPAQFVEDQYIVDLAGSGMRKSIARDTTLDRLSRAGNGTALGIDSTGGPAGPAAAHGPWDALGHKGKGPGLEAVKGPLLVGIASVNHAKDTLLIAKVLANLPARP